MNQQLSDVQVSALYGRVSTAVQDGSKETQLETGQRFAAEHKMRIPDEFVFFDSDTSGSKPLKEREEGQLMMNALRLNPQIRHLIVPKLDRLGRSLVDLLQTITELEGRGVTVHFCNLPMLSAGEDPMSKLMRKVFLQFLAVFAEFERDMIVQRINDSMQAKRARGELCGTVPYGKNAVPTSQFRTDKKGTPKEVFRLEPNPDEQRWIRKMDELRRQGWSYERIAKMLNDAGVPTKVPKGTMICVGKDPVTEEKICKPHSGLWQSGNVAKVLSNSYTKELLAAQPQEKAA